MKSIKELYEDSFIYNTNNINDEIFANNINSSICLIFDGVYDLDFFSNQIQQLTYSKITVVQILKGLVLVNFEADIEYLSHTFFKRIKLYNYGVSSIFLKKSYLIQLYDEIHGLKNDLFYAFFEDKFSINDLIENQFQNIQHIKKTTTNPQKCFYGFNNFKDLITFYIYVIQTKKTWPIFAILPQKISLHKYKFIKEEKQIIIKNKDLLNKSSCPCFNPIKNLFYISFIEKVPPEPQRQMNVSFYYDIKFISDLQISHYYQDESIRTFLGFENKFRCFHVFEYIKNNDTKFIDIKIVNEIDMSIMNNIHSNLYYLETLNFEFDCSILFSINYKFAFNFNNYNNDLLSNFYCFDDYNDFLTAKECFKKSLKDKCDYIFKNLKMIDEEQYSILFPTENKKKNFSFIIFRMKNINESNKDKKPKLDIFLKEFSSFRSDVDCTIDGKKYIVVGFEKIEQRNKAFALFKNSKYYSVIKSYNPEYLFDPNSESNYMDNYIEKDTPIQSFLNSIPEEKLAKINNDNQILFNEIETNQNLRQSCDANTNSNVDQISLDKIETNQILKQSCDVKANSNENDINDDSNKMINNKTVQNQIKNEINECNNNETIKHQNSKDTLSNKTNDYTSNLDNLKEAACKVENKNDQNQRTKVSSNNKCIDQVINRNNINKNKYLISLSLYKKEKTPFSSGAFSKVYIVNRIKSQKKYVAKVFTSKPANQQSSYKDFINDIEFYCHFNNPALLKICGYNNRDFDNKKLPIVLLDYMPNGSLQKIAKHLNDTQKYTILLTISYGMKYLHLQGVIHRNLKPENVLFDSNLCPKICDFGLSIINDSELLSDQKCKNIIYIAPEILLKNASYSFKSDVYSFAFVAYKLLTGKEPFKHIKSNDQLFDAIKSGFRPDLSIISNSLICNFLRKCWSNDPNERPTFDAIFNEILSPQFRLAFKAKDNDISNYLDAFHIEIPFCQMNEEMIRKASDKGDVELMALYGQMLYFGINCQKNINKSLYYEIKAAEEGNIESMYFLSNILNENNSKESQNDSIKFLKNAADKGHDKAIVEYGKRLLFGKGCQVDYKQASKYLSRSLEFNDAEAMFIYGMMLKKGKGVRVNKRKASQFFQVSADLGNKNSMFEYAKMLHYGDGINVDMKKAELYYKNAINENNYDGFFGLGIMYIDGSFPLDSKYSQKFFKLFSNLENNELVFEYIHDELEKMIFNDCSENDYYDFAKSLIKMAECDPQNNNTGAFSNGLFSVESMKRAVSSIFQMLCGIFKSVFSVFNSDGNNNNDNNMDNSDDFINFSLMTNLYNQINNIMQTEKSKSIEEVEINNYPLFEDDDDIEVSFYLSNVSVPKEFRKCIAQEVEEINGKVILNVYRYNDPNSFCTFYTFSSPTKIIEISFLLLKNSMKFHLNFMPINESCLCFEDYLIPQEILPEFYAFLRKLSLINKIHQNIFDGNKICTYLLIPQENKITVNNLIRNFLLQKNVIFDSLKYPLENTIIINEQFIFKNKIHFEIIVNEIKSIESINIINIERNKLYLYYDNHLNNMFSKLSFICFKNKIDKMIALNHINKILFNGNKNVLKYDLNLHYATIDETFLKKEARLLIPTIFQKSRGFCEFQQNVLSIESPVPRTYVGFNSMKNLMNCYNKFFLKLKTMISRSNVDISIIDDLFYENEYNIFEEDYLFYCNL